MNKVVEFLIRAKDATKAAWDSVVSHFKRGEKAAKDYEKTHTDAAKKVIDNTEKMNNAESTLDKRRNDFAKRLIDTLKNKAIPAWNEHKEAVKNANGINGTYNRNLDNLCKNLGRLPFPLNNIGRALQAVNQLMKTGVGRWSAYITVFMAAYKATTMLMEKLNLMPKDPYKELRENNKKAAKEAEQAAKKFDEMRDSWLARCEKANEASEKVVKGIDAEAAAYLRLQKAMEAVKSAEGDSEMLRMQREKFEDMAIAGDETAEFVGPDGSKHRGSATLASQVGAYHDVLIAQKQAERENEKAAAASQEAADKITAKEEKLVALKEREALLSKQLEKANIRLNKVEGDESISDPKEYDRRWERANRDRLKIKKERERVRDSVTAAQDDVEILREEKKASDIRRKNIEEEGKLRLDRAKKAYDDLVEKEQKADADAAAEKAKADWDAWQETQRKKKAKDLADAKEVARVKAQAAAEEAQRAQERLAAARAQTAVAWGWYRDKDSLKAQLEEEKANATAESTFEKEFERLKFRRDWRTLKNLSLDEEAVRRVALAREEEKNAERWAQETAENTASTRTMLERIEQVVTAEE